MSKFPVRGIRDRVHALLSSDHDVHFGSVGASPMDWRKLKPDDQDADDDQLAETPNDVKELLGFDPADTTDL